MRLAMLPVACLALFLSSVDYGDALKVLSAPNVLHIGSNENIFVECQGCSGADIPVTIIVNKYPTEHVFLDSKVVTLNTGNDFQAFAEIKIPASDFSDDPGQKHYVAVEAFFPETKLKKVVLASFQSGYIFIQTDKPLYTPNSEVYYRIFAVTAGMKPVEGEDGQPAFIDINIVTPDGIVLPEEPVDLVEGLYSGRFSLRETVSDGVWKVVASFQSSRHQNYSSEFEVKEYVLPSFEVKILPEKNYFYVNDKQLTVNIEARYLFGQDVEGTAFVMFGILNRKTQEKQNLFSSIQRVLVIRGQAMATLEKAHILESFPSIDSQEGNSIYVAVSVLTKSGSDLVEAEKHGIHIVNSPYRINLKNTSPYFKPTMFFEVVVFVEYPDGSPAIGVPIVVEPGEFRAITTSTGFARLPINPSRAPSTLNIIVRTDDEQSVGRQATASMTAQPYSSVHKRYMHIGVGSYEVKLGDNLFVTFFLNAPPVKRDLTYLIQSKGQLVKHKRISTDLTSNSESLLITKEMLPSFRIIAYYHDENEVAADSIWVDVIDSCMGSLKLEMSKPAPSYLPREKFHYKITGDPGAKVVLVAVDQGVYALNNKHRLTQKKVWDIVEKADTGCTPGGGRNNMAVFKDAGLMFHSNIMETEDRTELKCPVSTSTKPFATLDVRSTLLSKYTEPLQRQCCLDGMAETPLSYSCERRKEYITYGKACADAFFDCCQELTKRQFEDETRDIVFMENWEIYSRTRIPESWLWMEYILPLCPVEIPDCKSTSLEKTYVFADSITTWHLTGISLSQTHGICVDDTLKVIVQKDFFIDLRLPYSAVRGEPIEIQAIIRNNLPDEITVQVHLIEAEHVCISASNKQQYTKIGPESTRSVPFIIFPMQYGMVIIEVKASAMDGRRDGIVKMLKVVPKGRQVTNIVSVNLSPAENDGYQMKNITNPIDANDVMPQTLFTQIFVRGVGWGPVVEKVLDGSDMSGLIIKPVGDGEQNMGTMALLVIATKYLDKTGQWERVGLSKRDTALGYIRTGYRNQLAFRNTDGSFAVFTGRTGLTWLTSYVAKVFAMAYDLVDIDVDIICGAIKWVIMISQMPDGMFKEVGQMIHGEMTGGIHGMDSDASMTAFSLIIMQEAQTICAAIINSIPGSISRAVGALESRLPFLTNPYAVAMVSYALANENKLNKEILYKFASQDSTHWPVANSYLSTLEATAYALLALVRGKEFADAAPIVKWLNAQNPPGGTLLFTQSTTMVYQALAEYRVNAMCQRDEMEISIQMPNTRRPNTRFTLDKERIIQIQSRQLMQEVSVIATGTGQATVSLTTVYHERHTTHKTLENCERFEVNVDLKTVQIAEDGNIYTLKIELLYKDEDKDAGMTILDIGLLTGYTPDISDLNKLSKTKDRVIAKYEMDKLLSDRGSLIIYLDKVSHTRREEVAFKIRQTMKVGVLQPAAVSVYEYYDEKHCVTFYHPAREQGLICVNDVCICFEEDCSKQKKGKIDNDERMIKICDAESKIEYVYKVTMENYEDHNRTDAYMMRINTVIKEGSSDGDPTGKLRTFIGYPHCREDLHLQRNNSYLIMGTFKNTLKIDDQYQYMLGYETWIEYWPTEIECQTPEYNQTCESMGELYDLFYSLGCEQ